MRLRLCEILKHFSVPLSTTYITCPADPKKTLGIKLPFLVMIIKNLKKYFTFEVQVSSLQQGGPTWASGEGAGELHWNLPQTASGPQNSFVSLAMWCVMSSAMGHQSGHKHPLAAAENGSVSCAKNTSAVKGSGGSPRGLSQR